MESCFEDLRSKTFQWEKRGRLSIKRTKWVPILELLGGLNPCQDGLGHFSDMKCPRVPVWVRGGGCNRYFGNAQIGSTSIWGGLPFKHTFTSCDISYMGRMKKWGLLCKMRTKWGPFQQFGPHEDQVLNWGLLWKHWIASQPQVN